MVNGKGWYNFRQEEWTADAEQDVSDDSHWRDYIPQDGVSQNLYSILILDVTPMQAAYRVLEIVAPSFQRSLRV